MRAIPVLIHGLDRPFPHPDSSHAKGAESTLSFPRVSCILGQACGRRASGQAHLRPHMGPRGRHWMQRGIFHVDADPAPGIVAIRLLCAVIRRCVSAGADVMDTWPHSGHAHIPTPTGSTLQQIAHGLQTWTQWDEDVCRTHSHDPQKSWLICACSCQMVLTPNRSTSALVPPQPKPRLMRRNLMCQSCIDTLAQ